MRRLLVLPLLLFACSQPGSGLFYPLGELRLVAFQGGERNEFELLGFDNDSAAAETLEVSMVSGVRQDRWRAVPTLANLPAPPELREAPPGLLRLEWYLRLSGGRDDILSFYLTQDEDGGLHLHAVGIGLAGGQDEALYWSATPQPFLPPLAQWQAPHQLQLNDLRRYDAQGTLRDGAGALNLHLTPQGVEVAQTPAGRFESLRIAFRLQLSVNLDERSYSQFQDGVLWLHPALGPVRYAYRMARNIGSDYLDLTLDRVELIGTNMPLPDPR